MQTSGMVAQGRSQLLHELCSEVGVYPTQQLNTLNTLQETWILCLFSFLESGKRLKSPTYRLAQVMAPQEQSSVTQELMGTAVPDGWRKRDVLKEQITPLGSNTRYQTSIYGTCKATHPCMVNTVCKHAAYLKRIAHQTDMTAVATIRPRYLSR